MSTDDARRESRGLKGRCSRRTALRAGAAGITAATLGAAGFGISRAQDATPVMTADMGDDAHLIDIGGRNLYLECQGEGGPTVLLCAATAPRAATGRTICCTPKRRARW